MFPQVQKWKKFLLPFFFGLDSLLSLLHPHFKSVASKEHSVYSPCCRNVKLCRNMLCRAEIKKSSYVKSDTNWQLHRHLEVRQGTRVRRRTRWLWNVVKFSVSCSISYCLLEALLHLYSSFKFSVCFVHNLHVDFFSYSYYAYLVSLGALSYWPSFSSKHVWLKFVCVHFQHHNCILRERTVFGQW